MLESRLLDDDVKFLTNKPFVVVYFFLDALLISEKMLKKCVTLNLPLRTRKKQTKKEQDILASAVIGLEHMLPMVRGRQSSDKKKLFFSPQQKTTSRHTDLLFHSSVPLFFKVLENLVNSSCSRHQTLFSLNRINFQPTLTLKASLDKLDRLDQK